MKQYQHLSQENTAMLGKLKPEKKTKVEDLNNYPQPKEDKIFKPFKTIQDKSEPVKEEILITLPEQDLERASKKEFKKAGREFDFNPLPKELSRDGKGVKRFGRQNTHITETMWTPETPTNLGQDSDNEERNLGPPVPRRGSHHTFETEY